jgi:hypothetical protein
VQRFSRRISVDSLFRARDGAGSFQGDTAFSLQQQMASTLKNCIWSPRRLRILHVDDPAYPLDTPAVIRVETANEMASACDNALTEYALSAEIDPHGGMSLHR